MLLRTGLSEQRSRQRAPIGGIFGGAVWICATSKKHFDHEVMRGSIGCAKSGMQRSLTGVRQRFVHISALLDQELAELPVAMERGAVEIQVVTERDRKSTRLNSSHSQISYAVFCLKK